MGIWAKGVKENKSGRGLLSFASSILGGMQQSSNIQSQIAAQKQEAEAQRRWNERMWTLNNRYNSPSAQMQRLRDAGLNPDLMYSQGNVGNSNAPAEGYQQPDMSAIGTKPTIGSMIQQGLQNDILSAQAENIKADTANKQADTDKKGAETDILLSDAKFRDALNQNQLDLGASTIDLNSSQMNLNDFQINKLRSECKKIDAETYVLNERIGEIRASIQNMEADAALKRIEAALATPLARAKINALAAQARLSNQEAHNLAHTLISDLVLKSAQTDLADAQARLLRGQYFNVKVENERLKWDLKMDKKFESVERTMGIVNQTTKSLAEITDIVGNFMITPKQKFGSRSRSINESYSESHNYHYNGKK